jgi:hypothetical protein
MLLATPNNFNEDVNNTKCSLANWLLCLPYGKSGVSVVVTSYLTLHASAIFFVTDRRKLKHCDFGVAFYGITCVSNLMKICKTALDFKHADRMTDRYDLSCTRISWRLREC